MNAHRHRHQLLRGRRVLVTGAGGPAGIAVIKELHRIGVIVIATDASSWATGLRFADHATVTPRGDDPGFSAALLDVAKRDRADVAVVTVAEELLALTSADASRQLADHPCAWWLPSASATQLCVDKLGWADALGRAGVPVATTASAGDREGVARIDGPWIVKPRSGSGSRGVVAVDDEADLQPLLGRPDMIVQHRAVGREFTVDALIDRAGGARGAVPRWRLETKAGISTKGETFANPEVEHAALAALTAVGLDGPANVQGIVTAAGEVVLFETNPRFSGGLPLALAAGSDLVGQYLLGALGLGVDADALSFEPGRRMLRHFAEVFE